MSAPDSRPPLQRKGHAGAWSVAEGPQFEPQDAPARWTALALAAGMTALILIIAGVLLFTLVSRPRIAVSADAARARFQTAGAVLDVTPQADRAALERAHRAPNGRTLADATAEVVNRGWDEGAPPPSRTQIALDRAKDKP